MSTVGAVVCELPPKADNPRNSEGGFLALEDGRLFFAYSRFRGDVGHDDAPSDIAMLVSENGGESWRDGGVIVRASDHQAQNIMSVTLLRMRNGDAGLFYCVRVAANDLRCHLRRSEDEGESWGDAMRCIEPPGYFVVNNDRVLRLSSGRLIMPAAYHRNGYDSKAAGRTVRFDRRAIDLFFLSDDDGASWVESEGKCTLPYHRHSSSGLQEPGVLELSNGTLWAWARTDLGRQYEMFSFDSGETWTVPEPSRFTSPQSPMSMKRIPGTERIVAVWNPIPNYNGRSEFEGKVWTGGRTPLVIATSGDEGRTWSSELVIEDEPDHGYCYTAIHFSDETMLLAYCAGGIDDGGCLNRLRIRSVPIDALPV